MLFRSDDHRSFRSREWLLEGLQKVDQLAFLTADGTRTIGQAALKWLLAEPLIGSALPNIYNSEQLAEFAAASETPDLTAAEVARVDEFYDRNFNLQPAVAGVAS